MNLSPEIIARAVGPQAPKLRPPCQVLAIDPGCTHSAYVLYETGTRTIAHFDKVANDALLEDLRMGLFQYRRAAIEMVQGYGMAVGKEVFETVFWTGRFFETIQRTEGFTPDRLYRKDIKIHLCGTTKAKDPNVRQAMIDMFGPSKAEAIGVKAKPGKLYGITKDCWAALALAVAWAGIPVAPPSPSGLFAAEGKR